MQLVMRIKPANESLLINGMPSMCTERLKVLC